MAIRNLYPSVNHTLSLNFAQTETLDPRITFTRASTATGYDGKQFAKAEENLLTYSQSFGETVWVKTNATVGASVVSPDNLTTASVLTATAANATILQSFTATAVAYTGSIYVRRVTGTGNIQLTVDGTTFTTVTVTTSWTRVSTTLTPSAGSKTFGVRIVTSGDVIEIWGGQLEQRSALTAYNVTTTQPVTNYIPVLKTYSANEPRLEKNPITGESLGLLMEEQRTNLLKYSEQFDNSSWNKTDATIQANTTIAPDGVLSADKFIPNNVSTIHKVAVALPVISGTSYTISVYAKAGGYSGLGIVIAEAGFGTNTVDYFDLTTGKVTTNASGAAGISHVGNGWYRCTATRTATATIASTFEFRVGLTSFNFAGDGTSGIYIWGAQLEAGSFPTSYIPTTSAQATRAADSAAMTGSNFSSWYRQDEGTFLAAYSRNSDKANGNQIPYVVSDGTGNNVIAITDNVNVNGAGDRVLIVTNGVSQVNMGFINYTADQLIVRSVGYKLNDVATSSNGAAVVTDDSALIPAVNQLSVGFAPYFSSSRLNGHIRRFAYYPKRLSNPNLQALTT